MHSAPKKVLRNRHILALDATLFAIAPFVLYAVRFEGFAWAPRDLTTAITFGIVQLPVALLICHLFGMYRRLWRYASIAELELIGVAAGTLAAVNGVLGAMVLPASGLTPVRVPLAVLVMYGLLAVGILAIPRLLARMSGWRTMLRRADRGEASESRALIAGAGNAGEMILKELLANVDLGIHPVGFIDDDKSKVGMRLGGLRVLGTLGQLEEVAQRERVDQVIIAMPRAAGNVVRGVVRSAYSAGLKTRTVPGLFELISGQVHVNAIREVRIEDLLRRDMVDTNTASLSALCANRTVLVTGAGGSIGSELCRQISALKPRVLVLVGHGENPIFDISRELRATTVGCEVMTVIADIRDHRRVKSIFEQFPPDVVFHAAAHKHVPLMEENVVEAITNNVLGTKNVVDASVRSGVKHFVLISTDKAVRPTNVMGATKRVAEHVVHDAAIRHRRNFVAVRFGNVLGSQGSVVPTFVRQIREGGPLTVTHPEMRRYFMTIPESVQLVLQAASIGKGGELFMLDMGEPVKVVDLARDMIRLSGLEEGVDIEIEFTGIRPGEKLYEEMFFSHEVAEPTAHPKILRARNALQETLGYAAAIDEMITAAVHHVPESELRQQLVDLVPDYKCGDLRARPLNIVNEQDVRSRPSGEVMVRSLEEKRRA
jgi:FlaA1/EpsC-like NDP-sugar epimerase